MKNILVKSIFAACALTTSVLYAGGHMMSVTGEDQDVSGGTVTASEVKSEENGWLVVHRTDDTGKPGPVVGYAPLREGINTDVVAILTEEVAAGDLLMLMLPGR